MCNLLITRVIVNYKNRKPFLPKKAPHILFTFDLSSDSLDIDVTKRLKQISDVYVVVSRSVPRKQRQRGKEDTIYNFDESVLGLIKWLRNLR